MKKTLLPAQVRAPSLIQRCIVNKDIQNIKTLRTGEYLKLDYMGSSEFEFGAFPRFQREANLKLSKLVPHSHTHNGVTLHFLCEIGQAEDYAKIIENLLDQKLRLKERSGLSDKEILYVGKKKTPMFDQPHARFKFDVWVDLDNAIVISRDIEVLNNLKFTIPNAVHYMDQLQKAS